MPKARIAAYLLGSALLLSALAWALVPSPVRVEVGTVRKGRFVQSIEEDGRTRVRERFVVSAPLDGALARIDLEPGDVVAAGGVVASIDPPTPGLLDRRTEAMLAARLAAAEAQALRASANEARAEAAEHLARAESTRIAQLAVRALVSRAEIEAADATLRVREQELEATREERHAAAHDLDEARAALARAIEAAPGDGGAWLVRAPAAGTVLRVLQESATDVHRGQALLELGDPENLEVVVDILSSDAVLVRAGGRVELDHWGGTERVSGTVRRVERAAYTKTSALGVEEQRVDVVIDPAGTGTQWKMVGDGYRVEARLVVDERPDAILIPSGALFPRGTAWCAYVVSDGRSSLRVVDIDARGPDDAVARSGVRPGDLVVLYPSDRLADGTRISVDQPHRPALPADAQAASALDDAHAEASSLTPPATPRAGSPHPTRPRRAGH